VTDLAHEKIRRSTIDFKPLIFKLLIQRSFVWRRACRCRAEVLERVAGPSSFSSVSTFPTAIAASTARGRRAPRSLLSDTLERPGCIGEATNPRWGPGAGEEGAREEMGVAAAEAGTAPEPIS
jgi:hypothetical protein